ncbi:unnamed protein product [Meganyctiphanes norvegica]|uniref:Uncharacterized protein n=1 Tax=Meganyctiphanes norvegica TaxID=48144 RepID=A0AAV2QKC8_MEGNR
MSIYETPPETPPRNRSSQQKNDPKEDFLKMLSDMKEEIPSENPRYKTLILERIQDIERIAGKDEKEEELTQSGLPFSLHNIFLMGLVNNKHSPSSAEVANRKKRKRKKLF